MKDITGHFLAIIAAATAGVTARGQVHLLSVTPVNAVGYVNTILTPGFNLVSNPLYAADNKIPALFVNIQGRRRRWADNLPHGERRFFIPRNGPIRVGGLIRPCLKKIWSQVTAFSCICLELITRF
jgi:hypothetical protein